MSKRERMAAYREAARMVAEGERDIHAIADVVRTCSQDDYCPACQWQLMFESWDYVESSDKAAGIISYCLAAEMVRTGDL